MRTILQKTIETQRNILIDLLQKPISELVYKLSPDMGNLAQLEKHLQYAFPVFQYCKYLYVMDNKGIQLTTTLSHHSQDKQSLGRDRSARPYMQYDFIQSDFSLSEAYISKHNKRPSVTAIHTIKDLQNNIMGFLGVDYDLRELPGSHQLYKEKSQWQQVKGDPAIRSALFFQQRQQSEMDNNLDNVFALMQALICEHGVFHGKFHFSSSRTTIWLFDDPYNYRLLSMNELNDPDICLAYPRHPYSKLASVPKEEIVKIFDYFRQLRFADDTVYLRAGSINIVNGMISLNFSCDGSHYLPYKEFLSKGMSFWFGAETDTQQESPMPSSIPNTVQRDELIETICAKGCNYVYESIKSHHDGIIINELESISSNEQDKIIKELAEIMHVYDH